MINYFFIVFISNFCILKINIIIFSSTSSSSFTIIHSFLSKSTKSFFIY